MSFTFIIPCKMIALLFISVMSLQGTAANRYSMPVLLIDTENILKGVNINPNPFRKMSSESFGEIIRSVVHRSERVMIFVEEYFSVEDITTKDAAGTPYYHIHQGFIDSKINYIPNVMEPFKTLKQLFTPLDGNVFYLSDSMKSFDRNFKYYYIFFQDGGFNETRVQRLRRHDKIIRMAYYSIRHQSPGPIVAFYTGKSNPMHSVGRAGHAPEQPAREQEPRDVMIVTDGALFRLTGVYSTSGRRSSAQAAPVIAEQTMSRRSLSTRMLYSDFELQFNFQYLPDEWRLDTVSLLEGGEEVGRTVMGVGAPYDYSYFCAEPIVICNGRDRSLVTISQYQVEALNIQKYDDEPARHKRRTPDEPPAPGSANNDRLAKLDAPSQFDDQPDEPGTGATEEPSGNGTDKKTRFTRAVSCGPYFSSNILAGLFVVALLLGIMFYGIVTLFNCEGNGRYDDANQKPLVIVAQL